MMKKLYFMVLTLVLAVILIWLQAEPPLFTYETFMPWRSALLQLTGIVSVLLLTMTMLLAMRLPLFERLTRGLDKSYRLHKWTAIYGVVIGAIHWLLAIVPKQLVSAGVMERPQRGVGVPIDPDSLYAIIQPLRSGAESLGEWTLYLFIGLILLALFVPIKYKLFKWTHKLMAIAFVAIGYHSLVLLKHAYWGNLITPVTVIVVVAGIIAAVWSLVGRIGHRRKHTGVVTSVEYNKENQTTKVVAELPNWRGHKAGQFAFLKLGDEEPHPFTIASYDDHSHQVSFLIKALGDFTADIQNRVTVGQAVEVEGPYGQFDFEDNKKQVWIAGGIGCAAFKARLEQLAKQPRDQKVVFYYCTQAPSPLLIQEMKLAALSANIEFHLIDNRLTPFLSIEQILQQHPDLSEHSIWFCGPVGFKNALQGQLKALNMKTTAFHAELFNFR
ncbi:ferredoxin reductase family protein [Vibrio chaetopteri]|uniref:Ferric reductase-like transmembrane domain-containing protein n=1 Tax=Vibrio chaetopteri TaxID=3016528 RepID=A0AAU8BM68_9VIBR